MTSTEREMTNHNALLVVPDFYYPGIIGGKTGYTDAAQSCLSNFASRNGMTLIVITLHAMDGSYAAQDNVDLLNYGFDSDVISTIGFMKFESKYKLKDGNTIKLILWDTAGQERFRSLALNSFKAVRGIILVFDVTLKSSFENISAWLNRIDENFNRPEMILFGNKIDKDKNEWKVTKEEAEKFAKENNLTYFETSAKTKEGIEEGFDYLINKVYENIIGNSVHEEEENKVINLEENKEEEKEENSKEEIVEVTSGCFGRKKKKKKKADKKNNNKNKNKEKAK